MKTTMKRVLLGALAVVAAVGCVKRLDAGTPGGGGGADAAIYYPLAVGNRWTYQVKLLGEASEQTVRIEREVGGVFFDNQGGQLSVDAFGITDRKRYLLREPVEAGGEWTNVVSVSSTERYRILEVGPPCVVPAGRFERCVRVESRNRLDAKTTLVNEITFAPRVGIVRIQVVAETGGQRIPQTELLLKSYELAR